MSLIVAFVVALLSSVVHSNIPQCKHGSHMHVIWKNQNCQGESRISHK